jgi:hypothetical protein
LVAIFVIAAKCCICDEGLLKLLRNLINLQ